MISRKLIFTFVGLALAGGVVVLLAPTLGQSKPRQPDLVSAQNHQDAQKRQAELAWKPVEAAMSAGDVGATNSATKAFLAKGYPMFDSTRVILARFYIAHSDNADAKQALDPIVYGVSTRIGGNWIAPQGYDPRYFDLWKGVSAGVTSAERDHLMSAWANAYRSNGLKPGAFPEMGPAALMEYTLGQECLGNSKTRKEALDHFRRAFAASPNSLEIAQQLIMELRFAGDKAGAKVVAIRAGKLVDDPKAKFSIHAMGGVTKEDIAAANGKP